MIQIEYIKEQEKIDTADEDLQHRYITLKTRLINT